MERYDIAIIGTGPAGISSAITAKIRNKKVLLLGNNISEKMSKATEILNYPGFPSISGNELSDKLKNHLDSLDIIITEKKVNTIFNIGKYFVIQTANEAYEATTVILATGVVMNRVLDGEKDFIGKGVSYCATCDGMLYRGKDIAVIGYNEEACREAEYLADIVEHVEYFPMSKDRPKNMKNLSIVEETPVSIKGNNMVESLVTENGEHKVNGIFILRDAVAADQLVPGLQLVDNHIPVNLNMETSIPGLFACGDIAGKPYQYIKAAGQGNVAALSAVAYLLKNDPE
ncbi:MAG: NAD(P)/FAD-dependent oxidoreductase [Eubacteriales bacterium]|nr:NAD(P)/FAD-dependent oxidoreductase [Eubacteriales bacterium]